jgi:transposase, IS30 family
MPAAWRIFHTVEAPNLGEELSEDAVQVVDITSDFDYLAIVACEINNRPRKILNWKKPSEIFAELVTANASTA